MSRTTLRAAAALVLLAMSPSVAAEPATLTLSSAAPVLVEGRVTVEAPGGQAHLYDPDARGTYALRNATGWLRVYTVQAFTARTDPLVVVQPLPATLEKEEFRLDGSDVTIALSGERFELKAVASEGGAVTVEGALSGAKVPRRLDERVDVEVNAGRGVFGAPEKVPVSWQEGWAFVGAYEAYGAVPLDGFPAPASDATLGLRGRVRLHTLGGVVAFVDALGEPRSFRTGNWSDGASSVETRRDVFFEGTVEGASVGAGPFWGVGAPEATWTLVGAIEWADATGTVIANGTQRAFSGQAVRGHGVVAVRPDPPRLAQATRAGVAYEASGDWDALLVGTQPVVAPPGLPMAAVAGASLAALLLALVALYTRLARGDLLGHPRRLRLYQEVEAHPGVHLRELHRRLGGGWTVFRVHLHLLERGGYVRVEPGPHYALAFPAHASPQGVAIPHPLARAVYEALPRDGSAVPLRALRERVGTTRQLLNYHAQRLRDAGLIALRPGRGGRTASRLK